MSKIPPSQRRLERLEAVLELIKALVAKNPNQDTFYVHSQFFYNHTPLLQDYAIYEKIFKEIAERSNGHVNILSQSMDITIQYVIQVYDTNTLNKCYLEIQSELQNKKYQFTLDTKSRKGYLFISNNKENKCAFSKNSFRYNLLIYLAKNNHFKTTEKLADHFKVSNLKIRKTIDDIRARINKQLHIPRESIFENEENQGYKIDNIQII
jgi:hypothetical protein